MKPCAPSSKAATTVTTAIPMTIPTTVRLDRSRFARIALAATRSDSAHRENPGFMNCVEWFDPIERVERSQLPLPVTGRRSPSLHLDRRSVGPTAAKTKWFSLSAPFSPPPFAPLREPFSSTSKGSVVVGLTPGRQDAKRRRFGGGRKTQAIHSFYRLFSPHLLPFASLRLCVSLSSQSTPRIMRAGGPRIQGWHLP